MIHVQLVMPANIQWGVDLAKPLLDKGLVRQKATGKYPLAWCCNEISEGRAQLWLVWKDTKLTAAVMTTINHYPSGQKYMEVFLMGGWKMALWAEKALDSVLQYARLVGCQVCAAGGRLGWNRIAKKYGDKVKTDSLVAIDLT